MMYYIKTWLSCTVARPKERRIKVWKETTYLWCQIQERIIFHHLNKVNHEGERDTNVCIPEYRHLYSRRANSTHHNRIQLDTQIENTSPDGPKYSGDQIWLTSDHQARSKTFYLQCSNIAQNKLSLHLHVLMALE